MPCKGVQIAWEWEDGREEWRDGRDEGIRGRKGWDEWRERGRQGCNGSVLGRGYGMCLSPSAVCRQEAADSNDLVWVFTYLQPCSSSSRKRESEIVYVKRYKYV